MMTPATLHRVVVQLRQTAAARQLDALADAELLARFRADRDPEAFEAIVRRYGGAVLGACRKVLPGRADAEDAFQATFLVLLQSGHTIRQGQALAGWLTGVAHRVALKALAATARRERVEKRNRRVGDDSPDLSWREACAVLHEELDRLPDKYRLPLLLCYLGGKSRDEAAQQLGVELGTLRGRLARGRDRLRARLTRRGVTLSAGLMTFVANSVPAGGPPETLLRSTLEAAATGRIPAQVAALLHGATPSMALGKITLLTTVVLVAGFLAAIGLPTAAQPPAEKTQASTARATDQAALAVAGTVVGPDGKPVPAAKLYLVSSKRTKPEVVATADESGKFRFAVKPEEVGQNGRVVATGGTHAPDWIDLARAGKGPVTLRLRKDDIAFTGKVVTLEGQPVAGATIEAERLGKPEEGEDLKPWLDRNVSLRKESIWLNERNLVTVAPPAFGPPLTATTDKDGKFRLTGAGSDRVLAVRVRGEGIEHKFVWIVTRPDAPRDGYIKTGDLNHGVYGPELTVLVGPAKPITGTVLDRATGKPVAGIKVQEVRRGNTTAFTDAKGKFRLDGVPKGAFYAVSAAGGPGLPYFDVTQFALKDTPGLDPLAIEFQLDRGIEIAGRVTDQVTGQPVAGRVHYNASENNPNLKDFPPNAEPRVIISDWGQVRPDGTYSVLAIPGPGALCVCASAQSLYPVRDVGQELRRFNVRGQPVAPVHAVLGVDVDPKAPASLVWNVTLSSGKSRKGTVLDPDGRPLEGVAVAGLTPGERPDVLKSAEFTLAGLGDRKRVLIFVHPEKKLGGQVVASGESPDAITVKLQPLGTLTGQVVDSEGKPWAGLKVALKPRVPRVDYDNLPNEMSAFQGLNSISRGFWSKFLGREVTTDKDGRFTLDGVLPGTGFDLYVSDGDLAKPLTLVTQRRDVRAEAGKTSDLGVLKKE